MAGACARRPRKYKSQILDYMATFWTDRSRRRGSDQRLASSGNKEARARGSGPPGAVAPLPPERALFSLLDLETEMNASLPPTTGAEHERLAP